ncbi:hypothetical protein HYW55_03855 [Candidatus Gottesmanbacteria bacterium]|nr:hypothetical protein [Candidatus Gottesmanbacteria bacterium]
METALFWILWGLISFWALKTFYYSFSKRNLEKLRIAAFGIDLSVFVLTFIQIFVLIREGNFIALLFFLLLIISIILFAINTPQSLKLGASAMIANTFILFLLMTKLRPGTFILTRFDIGPIIAVMLLLMGDVVVLLLWQQLQLKERKRRKK